MVGAIAFVPEGEVPQVWRQLKPVLSADLAEFAAYYELAHPQPIHYFITICGTNMMPASSYYPASDESPVTTR